MNRRKAALESIKKVQDCKYKEALLLLKSKIDLQKQAKDSLTMLENYIKEYQTLQNDFFAKGALLTRQSFLENLNVTLAEQRRVVEQVNAGLVDAQHKVAGAYKSVKGLEIMINNEMLLEQKVLLEKESAALDELIIVQHNRRED